MQEKHIKNCRLIPNKEKLLHFLPKNGVCAEIGILHANYSEQILRITNPHTLHLFDIDKRAIDNAVTKFPDELENGKVKLHHEDSSSCLKSLRDVQFDWMYITAMKDAKETFWRFNRK